MPKLIINKVKVTNSHLTIHANIVELYPKISALFSKQFHLRKLKLIESDIICDLASIEDSNNIAESIILDNSTLSIIDKNKKNLLKNLAHLSASINYQPSPVKLTVIGSIPYAGQKINLNLNITSENEHLPTHLQISSKDFNLVADGKFNNKYEFSGNNIIKIEKLTNFLNNNFLLPISVTSDEKITIVHDITYKDDVLNIENIKIDSNNIKGSGRADFKVAQEKSHNIALDFLQINLDNISKEQLDDDIKQQMAERETLNKITPKNTDTKNYFLFLKDTAVQFKINIKEIVYNKQSIKDLQLYASSTNNNTKLDLLKFNIPGETAINISGAVVTDYDIHKLDGKINITGNKIEDLASWLGFENSLSTQNMLNKFNFASELLITPNSVNFNNFLFDIEDITIEGDGSFNHNNYHPRISSNIRVAELNLDKYNTPTDLFDLDKFFANKKFDIENLRKIQTELLLYLTCDKLIFNKISFDKINADLYMAPGVLKIENLQIDSDDARILTNLNIDTKSLKPTVQLNIYGPILSTKFLNLLYNITPIEADSEVAFSPPNFEKFDGSVKVQIDHFQTNNKELQNLAIELNIQDNMIMLEKFETVIAQSKISLQGNILPDSKLMNLSFGAANLHFADILPYLQLPPVNGYASISGSLSSYGDNYKQLNENLRANFSMAARQAEFKSINVDEFANIVQTFDSNGTKLHKEKIFSQAVQKDKKSILKELDAIYTYADQILSSKATKFTTDFTSGNATVSLDLKNSLIHLNSQFAFLPKINTNPISVGIRMDGAISAPIVSYDTTVLEKYLGK